MVLIFHGNGIIWICCYGIDINGIFLESIRDTVGDIVEGSWTYMALFKMMNVMCPMGNPSVTHIWLNYDDVNKKRLVSIFGIIQEWKNSGELL